MLAHLSHGLKFAVLASLLLLIGILSSFSPAAALSWERVDQTSFGSSENIRVTRFKEFNSRLYAVIQHYNGSTTDTQIWSTANGTSWIRSTSYPVISSNALYNDMEVFGSYLYVAQSNDGPDRAYVYRSSDGTSWQAITVNGFGDAGNIRITRLLVFNDFLYAFTANAGGLQAWRTSNGTDWSQVGTSGLGSVDNIGLNSYAILSGRLYVGTATFTNRAQILSTQNGTDWTLVSATGMGSDYGAIGQLVAYYNSFYNSLYALAVKTTNGSYNIFQPGDGTTWNVLTTTGLDPVIFDEVALLIGDHAIINDVLWFGQLNTITGAKLLYSTDVANWNTEGPPGMGNANNKYIHPLTLYKNYFYVGFDNTATGFQIWRAAITPLSLTSSIASGTVNVSYTQPFSIASGTSPYTIQIGSLPPGIDLVPGNNFPQIFSLSGTPTIAGNYSFSITLTDSGVPPQTLTQNYTLSIATASPSSSPSSTPTTSATTSASPSPTASTSSPSATSTSTQSFTISPSASSSENQNSNPTTQAVTKTNSATSTPTKSTASSEITPLASLTVPEADSTPILAVINPKIIPAIPLESKPDQNLFGTWAVFVLLMIGLIIWVVWHFRSKNNSKKERHG